MTIEIPVRQYHEGEFVMNEDGEFLCSHPEVYIDPACCDGAPDESGRDTCGCHGRDSVTCPAVNCTGIEDWEVDGLFERLA